MQRQWFGDPRDYVKWSVIRELAGEDHFLYYIPMLRPDKRRKDFTKIHPDVHHFFDKCKDLNQVAQMFPAKALIFERGYSESTSQAYFNEAVALLKDIPFPGRKIIFIDPDTGIAPASRAKNEHLKGEDIRLLWAEMNLGDQLIIYQHKWRNPDWLEVSKNGLAALVQCVVHQNFQPSVASDVCFLCATK